MGTTGGLFILVLVLGGLLCGGAGLVLNAAILHGTVKLAKIENASFGKAIGVSILSLVLSPIIGLITTPILLIPLIGVLLALGLLILATALMIKGLYSTTFGKAFLATIYMILEALAIGVAVIFIFVLFTGSDFSALQESAFGEKIYELTNQFFASLPYLIAVVCAAVAGLAWYLTSKRPSERRTWLMIAVGLTASFVHHLLVVSNFAFIPTPLLLPYIPFLGSFKLLFILAPAALAILCAVAFLTYPQPLPDKAKSTALWIAGGTFVFFEILLLALYARSYGVWVSLDAVNLAALGGLFYITLTHYRALPVPERKFPRMFLWATGFTIASILFNIFILNDYRLSGILAFLLYSAIVLGKYAFLGIALLDVVRMKTLSGSGTSTKETNPAI